MKIHYCKKCKWWKEVPSDIVIVNRCENCHKWGLSFVIGTKEEVEEFLDKLVNKE